MALPLGAAAAASLVLLPLFYLAVRAVGGGERALATLSRGTTWELAGRSVGLAVVTATASLLLGGALAWFTAAQDLRGRRWWTVLAVTPLAAPCYLGASVYLAGLSPQGPIGSAWSALGLGRPPVMSGFWPAAFVLTLFVYPYAYLPLRAVFSRLDRSPYEAARTLGRPPWRALVSGVLPQALPAAAGGWLFVGLYTLSEFGAVSLLRCDTFTRAIYLEYQSSFDRSSAAVMSLILIAMASVFLLASDRFGGRGRGDARTGQTGARLTWCLGAWRWPATAISTVTAALTTGVVLIVTADWATRGAGWEQLARTGEAALNTAGLAVVAGLVTLVAAWPIAQYAARRRSWASVALERLSHLGFALPGVAAALGLAFFALRTPFYQTWAVLIAAYLIMFLPQAVTPVRAALTRASPRMEEAARTLGRSPTSAFLRVTLPQAAPGAVAAWLLVLITTARELPATLLLAPTGARTLASELWDAMTEAEYARAAAPAIGLLLVSCGAVLLVVRREGLAA